MCPVLSDPIDQTIEKLTSPNAQLRHDGWRELRDRSAEYRPRLDVSQLKYLNNLAGAEADPANARAAIHALLALTFVLGSAVAHPAGPAGSGTLLEQQAPDGSRLLPHWLWEPFRGRSAVLGVTATNFRRRDEGALQWLGRRLSFAEFGRTEFPSVSLENPDLEDVLFSDRYQAFCIVGRLGLFGEQALDLLGNSDLRFGFDVPRRPKGLPPGELDGEYHCVYECAGPSRKKKCHKTVEKGRYRTDFAVVQRYQVELGFQHVVVVVIAGASSLGTSAAAQWAAYNLFRSAEALGRKPIEVPSRITPVSRMEALLSAKAKITTSAWQHPEIQLRELSVDNACWSLENQDWQIPPIKLIRVKRKAGIPVEILFDDELSQLRPGKQTFRLMVAIVEQVRQTRNPELDLEALAANNAIWDKEDHNVDYVRCQLRTLRSRHLRDALNMHGPVRLEAEVDDVDEP